MNDRRHRWVLTEDVRLHCVTAGDPGDPLVVLLHGFPEFWYSWRRQLPALAEAGYHAVAVDLRGYNRSGKPSEVSAYRLERLVSDVRGLFDRLGTDTATLVGHDWGGVIAWEFAHRNPERLDALAVLNAPHLDRLAEEITNPTQLRRSWYAGVFQIPTLPEAVLERDFGWLDRLLGDAFSEDDVRRYREALSRPGSLTAAIDYYRALGRTAFKNGFRTFHGSPPGRNGRIDVPTLLCWGDDDPALGIGLSEDLDRWVRGLRVEHFETGHWLQNEAPERLNATLLDFLAFTSDSRRGRTTTNADEHNS